MPTIETALPIHPVLQELGLLLPLPPESSWAFHAALSDGAATPTCRISLAADRDLIVEVADGQGGVTRFVFDAEGRLVSVGHSRHLDEAPFADLRSKVLAILRARCLLA